MTLFCIFFNIVIRGSPEQRCEGNLMNIWGRESRQREDQTLKPETGAHLAVRCQEGCAPRIKKGGIGSSQ